MNFLKLFSKVNKETNNVEIVVTESPVGQISGSRKKDFYVYEWFIAETGEVFYVGKGRGTRYKDFHNHAYEAERIRELFKTDVRFVGENLTEDEAIELETKEILRILNETQDRLTNRITPILAKRSNGYGPSSNTPKLERLKTPVFWVAEIDEHYFGVAPREFDKIDPQNLKKVYFFEKKVLPQEVSSLYGHSYEPYYREVCDWLIANGYSIIKTKFAKSVTSWVYIGDDDVHNYNNDQKNAMERLGRNIPVYHLIDLWHYIKESNE